VVVVIFVIAVVVVFVFVFVLVLVLGIFILIVVVILILFVVVVVVAAIPCCNGGDLCSWVLCFPIVFLLPCDWCLSCCCLFSFFGLLAFQVGCFLLVAFLCQLFGQNSSHVSPVACMCWAGDEVCV
jgi:hypothetical protein